MTRQASPWSCEVVSQLRDATLKEDPDSRPEEHTTPAVTWSSVRWILGALPWVAVVVIIALVDGGCAPVDDEDPRVEEPTPFPDFGDDDDAVADDDDDGGIGGPYPAVLNPEFDEVGVSRLAPLWVELSEEGVPAEIRLEDAAGNEVSGTSLRVGAVRYIFLPDTAFDALATYTMTVEWAEDETLSWSFTTRDARTSVGAPNGVTVRWNLESAAASSPPGAEGFLGQLPLSIATVLDGAPPSVLAGTVEEAEGQLTQDLCAPTFEPTAEADARWEDPLLVTPPTVVRLSVDLSIVGLGLQVLPLRDVRLAAELEADDGGIVGIAEGSFVGWVDLREVAFAGVCDTLSAVAIECVPCPGDGGDQCLVFALEDVEGSVIDLALERRTAADVKADPGCVPGPAAN